jgi:carbamoyltransferase
MLAAGKIVGWHQGQGEIGPRALGNRSILMDPRIPSGKDIINNRVKHRETFRPFGASVLESHASTYFDINYRSPYMLHVVNVLDIGIPSVTHIDGTSRVQTVNQLHTSFYKLLTAFYELTGCAVLLNTSLNNNGKPIASTEEDSIEFFKSSNLDAICIGNRIYKK